MNKLLLGTPRFSEAFFPHEWRPGIFVSSLTAVLEQGYVSRGHLHLLTAASLQWPSHILAIQISPVWISSVPFLGQSD